MKPRVVCEVGVNLPQFSKALHRINEFDKLILIEPSLGCCRLIREHVRNASYGKKGKTILLHNVAIWDKMDTVKMLYTKVGDPMSCLKELMPAGRLAEMQTGEYEIKATTFDQVDTGDIDYLFISAEGADYFVLKNLVSRPEIIRIEMCDKQYTNPYFKEIEKWMKDNHYGLDFKIGSDHIYRKNHVTQQNRFY